MTLHSGLPLPLSQRGKENRDAIASHVVELLRVHIVADDSESDRFLTIQQLDKAQPFGRDMTVASAKAGVEAMEKIRSSQFTLVVDWNMPHLDCCGRCAKPWLWGRCREDIPGDVESMAAIFLNKDELDPINLRSAIAMPIQMQDTRCSVGIRPGNDLRLQI